MSFLSSSLTDSKKVATTEEYTSFTIQNSKAEVPSWQYRHSLESAAQKGSFCGPGLPATALVVELKPPFLRPALLHPPAKKKRLQAVDWLQIETGCDNYILYDDYIYIDIYIQTIIYYFDDAFPMFHNVTKSHTFCSTD